MEHLQLEQSEAKMHKGMDAGEYHARLLELWYFEEAVAFEEIVNFTKMVEGAGGKALLVGGAVRDEVIGNFSKDFDVEVYGLRFEQIKELADKLGRASEVGAFFGIIKLKVGKIDIDLSMPRRESKTGKGHKGFDVEPDPTMTIKEAARRRDFTMNSLAKNILTGEIYDYFGGAKDIRERILKVTDEERFKDDPLRALRAMQFVGRFGLKIDDKSSEIIRETRRELKDLPKERLKEEWSKLFLQSPKPSLGLNAAMEFGIFHEMHKNEIVSLLSTPQEQEWHPEGDVWTHTLMVTDEAAKIIREENLEKGDALIVMLGAFCHDFGKPQTTKFESGRTRSLGHEEAGEKPAAKFLSDIGIEASLREPILKIVANHLKPSEHYINEVKRGKPVADGVFNRLAKKIYPATLKQLVLVAKADHLGRGPFVDPAEPQKYFIPIDYPAGEWFLERAKKLNIVKEMPPHIIQGRDLIALGFQPGKEFGEVIKLADALRDEKEFKKEDVFFLIYENKDKSSKDLIATMKNKLAISEGEVMGEGIAAE